MGGIIGLVGALGKFGKWLKLFAAGQEAQGKFAAANVGDSFDASVPDEAHVRFRVGSKRFEVVRMDFDTNVAVFRRLPDKGKGKGSGS